MEHVPNSDMILLLEEFRYLLCKDDKKGNGSTILSEEGISDSGVRRQDRRMQLDTRVPCYNPGLISMMMTSIFLKHRCK